MKLISETTKLKFAVLCIGGTLTYIVGKNDRTVHPDLERFVAKRMKATTHEFESSHVPMLSKPDLVLDVIRAAAKSVKAA